MPDKYYLDIDGVKTLIEKTTQLGGYVVMIDISGIDDPEQDWYNSSTGQITVTSDDSRRVKVARYQSGRLEYLPVDSTYPSNMPDGISTEELAVILQDHEDGLTTYNCLSFNTHSTRAQGTSSRQTYSWVSSDGQYSVSWRVTGTRAQRSYVWYFWDHGSVEDSVTYVCRQDIYLDEIVLDDTDTYAENYAILPESDIRFFKVYSDGREVELPTEETVDIEEVRDIFTNPVNLRRTKIQATMPVNDYETITNSHSPAYDDMTGSTVIEFEPSSINEARSEWQSTVHAMNHDITSTFSATMDTPAVGNLPQLSYSVDIVRPLWSGELNAMLNP